MISDLREQITKSIAGVDIEFVQILQDMLGDLEGSPEPVEIKIFGSSTDELTRIGDELGPELKRSAASWTTRGRGGGILNW